MKATLNFDSAEQILDFAIEKEMEANQFYVTWAEKVGQKAVSKVLLEFAGEELRHRDMLQQVKQGQAFKADTKHMTDMHITDHFTVALPVSSMSYQDALRVAIQRETGAIEVYRILKDRVTDTTLKDLFAHLEQEETRHKIRLESIYEEDFMKEN